MGRVKRRGGSGFAPLMFMLVLIAAAVVYALNLPVSRPEDGLAAVEGESFDVHYIDVDQGDCALIVSSGEAMLIDAGEAKNAEAVVDYIKGLGIYELTYVVATHPHSDHIGGLAEILDSFPVESFIAPDITHTTKTFENLLDAIERNNLQIEIAKPGDNYYLGNAFVTVLAPSDKDYRELNDYSVVMRAVYGDTSFLFTGDAERASEEDMLNAGFDLHSDVLKVGHHGSRSSTSIEFLEAVSPNVAVISCGVENSYGHPHSETMDILAENNVRVYQTNRNGTIVAKSNGKAIEIEVER